MGVERKIRNKETGDVLDNIILIFYGNDNGVGYEAVLGDLFEKKVRTCSNKKKKDNELAFFKELIWKE